MCSMLPVVQKGSVIKTLYSVDPEIFVVKIIICVCFSRALCLGRMDKEDQGAVG